MSLKNLEIPVALLIDLYANHLVDSESSSTKTEGQKDNSKNAPVLGGNAKHIAIIVSDEKQPFMKDDELEWLRKMLFACKLTLGDVAIVNLQPHKPSFALLKKQLAPQKVLTLGPGPLDLQLPLNFPQFRIQEHDGCLYLCAPPAAELNQETKEGKLLKSKLWVSLQKLFEV